MWRQRRSDANVCRWGSQIEGLKQTIARLLTKVTSTAQPVPHNEQLADMIHKVCRLAGILGA